MYSYLVIFGNWIIFVFAFGHFGFGKTNNIHICIRSFLGNWITFVFLFGHQNIIRWPLSHFGISISTCCRVGRRICHYTFLLWAFQPSFLSSNANLEGDQWLLHPFLNKNLLPVTSGGYFLGWNIYFCLTYVEYKFCCWTILQLKN